MNSFFEYKYLAMENYYKYIFEYTYSHSQAAGRCLVDFQMKIAEKSINSVAVISTILYQICSKSDEYANYKEEYQFLVKLCAELAVEELLNENEMEYLKDDLEYLAGKYET